MSTHNRRIIAVSKESYDKITDELLATLAENDVEIMIKEKEPVVIEIGGKGPLKIPAENVKSLGSLILKEDNVEIMFVEKEPAIMEISGEEILKMMEEDLKLLETPIEYDKKKPRKYVPKEIGKEKEVKFRKIKGKRYGR